MSREFSCPVDCLPGIAEVWEGQYHFKGVELKGTPLILDIGANCGAFSLCSLFWNWPDAYIHAFEPNPEIYKYLRQNCPARIQCHNAAVGDPALTTFHVGESALCSSQYPIVQSTQSITVRVIAPEQLPVADIVKIDAEGAEAYIIEHLPFTPKLLAVEWHSDEQRWRIEAALSGKMQLLESQVHHPGLGILKYIQLKK